MRGMNIIAKIKAVNKKRLLLGSMVLLVGIGVFAYWFINAGQLNENQQAENRQIQDTMKASYITGGMDRSRLANIDASKRAGKFAEALQELNTILEESNLTDNDKRTLYAIKGPLCLEAKDLACADDFVAAFNKLISFDYYFLVDAARLASATSQPEKAKTYYKMALDEIDRQGGQQFVDQLNQSTEVSLDYAEIRNGAGN